MFYSIFPLKGSTYAQLGKSLSKGYNLWEVREAGEGNSKKSLGNIQPPEKTRYRKMHLSGNMLSMDLEKKLKQVYHEGEKGSKCMHKHAHTYTHTHRILEIIK